MGRGRWSRGLLIVLMLLGVHASVAGASTGVISGTTASRDWTMGSVENLSVSFDRCWEEEAVHPGECHWAASAVVVSAESGGCPTGPAAAAVLFPLAEGHTTVWASDGLGGTALTANGTVESGYLTFGLREETYGPQHGSVTFDELCLYVSYGHQVLPGPECTPETSQNCPIFYEADLLASAILQPPPEQPSNSKACHRARISKTNKGRAYRKVRHRLRLRPSPKARRIARRRLSAYRKAIRRTRRICRNTAATG